MFRHQRHQLWWAMGVAFGVGVLSLMLNAGLFYFSIRDVRSESSRVNKVTGGETARWLAVSASQREQVAQGAALKQEQDRINEVLAALTNRLRVATDELVAAKRALAILDADIRDLLAPRLVGSRNVLDEGWPSEFAPYERAGFNGARLEKAPAGRNLFKTNEAAFFVLPSVGGDLWSIGPIVQPTGFDIFNKKGFPSSSYLIGIKRALP